MMKIKVTDLKKELKQYTQTELINLVVELFKANKEVQNFLSSKFLGKFSFWKHRIILRMNSIQTRGLES
jgi:hypothetical protein